MRKVWRLIRIRGTCSEKGKMDQEHEQRKEQWTVTLWQQIQYTGNHRVQNWTGRYPPHLSQCIKSKRITRVVGEYVVKHALSGTCPFGEA